MMFEAGDRWDSYELGLEYDVEVLSVEDGRANCVIWIQEGLDWHANREREIRESTPYFRLQPLVFEDDNSFTEDAFRALDTFLCERYEATHWDVAGCLTLDVEFDLPADSTLETLATIAHDLTVRFQNETDPGTFGSEYLFGSVIHDAMKERAAA